MKNKGNIFITIGLALLLAALCLFVYNIMDENRAVEAASDVFVRLKEGTAPMRPVPKATDKIEFIPTEPEFVEIADYVLNPDMDMPTEQIGEYVYIGTLEIPVLGLTLPVMEAWSYKGLKVAPGRYYGSVYTHDIVVAAHNYAAHFGRLNTLDQGEAVIFTDVDGNIFIYKVLGVEILGPYESERMVTGDWDLSLFTCTFGGAQRVTVRCELMEELPNLADS